MRVVLFLCCVVLFECSCFLFFGGRGDCLSVECLSVFCAFGLFVCSMCVVLSCCVVCCCCCRACVCFGGRGVTCSVWCLFDALWCVEYAFVVFAVSCVCYYGWISLRVCVFFVGLNVFCFCCLRLFGLFFCVLLLCVFFERRDCFVLTVCLCVSCCVVGYVVCLFV